MISPAHALELAREVRVWLSSTACPTAEGIGWPPDPGSSSSVDRTLYSGSAGVVLFLLELRAAAADEDPIENILDACSDLSAHLEECDSGGLYDGLGGVGFALLETWKATGQDRFRDAVLRSVRLLRNRAVTNAGGVEWNDANDVTSGTAGTGLFLLAVARELFDDDSLDLAIRAGDRLIATAERNRDGFEWRVSRSDPRSMPNFSHGTAGVAFFLADLYRATGLQRFLDAAVAGASLLEQLSERTELGLIPRDLDDPTLCYFGWCHGPPGTTRLFRLLSMITGDARYDRMVDTLARAVIESGIGVRPLPGFWNNYGLCCGTAGVARFALDLHRLRGEDAWRDLALELTKPILREAIRDENGARWRHAENRLDPEVRTTQTGWMQGAAGIGSWLIELSRFLDGTRATRIAFPDDPFAPTNP